MPGSDTKKLKLGLTKKKKMKKLKIEKSKKKDKKKVKGQIAYARKNKLQKCFEKRQMPVLLHKKKEKENAYVII